MTQLRDARFKRALEAAPDASAQPQAATRQAVREAARRAVARPAREASWWRRLVEPEGRMPWNAALATVMLAVVVGVMWHGQEGQQPERETPVASATSPSPAPSAAPAPAATPAPPPPAVVAQQSPPREKPAATAARAKSQAAHTEPPATRALADAKTQPPAEDSARRDAALSAEGRAAMAEAAPAAPPAPPAPAAAAAPALARAQRAESTGPAWTDVRITSGDRSVVVPRSQAPELASLVTGLLASRSSFDARAPDADLRIEVLRNGERVTLLDAGPGQPKLREEALRLLGR